MATCKAITEAGSKCKLIAGTSGYCHIHDPEKITARKEAQESEEKARKEHWEKGKHLREIIEVIQGVARSRGWDTWTQHVDSEKWQFATVIVERSAPRDFWSAKVTGAFEISLSGRFRMTNVRTSGESFGFAELVESVNEALRSIPWLKFPSPSESSAKRPEPSNPKKASRSRRIFIIHGHDNGTKEEVARFLGKIGLEPVILHEQPDRGKTIIEKFEEYSDVSFAVALLTPDDVGAAKRDPDSTRDRARQNVVFEFGYFVAKLGRNGACALVKDGVEIPSDYSGVLYIPMDTGGAWRFLLIRELRAAGFDVDANLAL
jgi:predicted nucleotide-binding protein